MNLVRLVMTAELRMLPQKINK